MRALLADDEPLARARLRRLVEEIRDIEVVGESASGRETLAICDRERPDVVFLDIRMPDLNGVETARRLATLARPPAIIFTTAYDHYALDAFATPASAYLLKPVRREDLQAALAQACKPNRLQQQQDNGSGATPRTDSNERSHIAVSSSGKVQLIPVADIVYFQADHKYVRLRHLNGEALSEETLKSLENEFSDVFTRIHRNALVANGYVKGIEKNGAGQYQVRMRPDDERLDISRRHLPQVRKRIKALQKQ